MDQMSAFPSYGGVLSNLDGKMDGTVDGSSPATTTFAETVVAELLPPYRDDRASDISLLAAV